MIRVQDDVWRADCIAAIGWDGDMVVQIIPVNCASSVDYEWDSYEEAATAYKKILEAWTHELGHR